MSDDVTDLTRGVYRRIYSGFIAGQRINKLSVSAEAWFWRILVTVDDFGNGRADPELCRDVTAGRRKVTATQVRNWVEEMRSVGLLNFYNAKGELYLHVTDFEASQPAGKNGKRIQRYPFPNESSGIQVNPDLSSASDNDNEEENNTDTEGVAHVAKPRSPSAPKSCDDEYLDDLQSREAYQLLDVRLVYSKMVAWCENKKKVPTRGRLINWLNREDQPLSGTHRFDPARSTNGDGEPRPQLPAPTVTAEELASLNINR